MVPFADIETDPGFLFLLLVPPVLYHAAGSLPKLCLIQSSCHIVMLGIIGVGAGTVMTAVMMRYVFPYDWAWPQSFLFGAIAAATDPVAAVSLFKEVSTCKRRCDIPCCPCLLS